MKRSQSFSTRMKGALSARLVRRIALAASLAGVLAIGDAHAGLFTCISGTSADCAEATSSLSWTWDGLDFTIAESGGGYVSEVYFDLGPGMSASFLGGTGGNVFFYAGANPASLPGGSSVGFVSDVSFDSDPSATHNGIDPGETATFRILGATADSFTQGSLAGGVHVRSLTDAGASLVTVNTVRTVPEPATLALFALGLVGLALSPRKH